MSRRRPIGSDSRIVPDTRVEQAIAIMDRFAQRTGVTAAVGEQRYLWTDAFAVCNNLGLHRATGDARHLDLARRLVDRVHHVLGRHRSDARQAGWLSGLSEPEGEAHPTRGGLRIGKQRPERQAHEPVDDRLEWEQDGQYFHYLTKWMHALDQMARSTGEARYSRWARTLMETAHRAFVYQPPDGATKRMYWKMSVDLSRPLVASMGHHDPMDGLVTCLQLEATAARLGDGAAGLLAARTDFETMLDRHGLATDDPLGLGGLLVDAFRIEQLARDDALRDDLLAGALVGLRHYARRGDLELPAAHRLAFRELGLAIGLAVLDRLQRGARRTPALDHLARFAPLGVAIEAFWLRPESRRADTWVDHSDINDVMLATCLAPEGHVVLA